MWVGARTCERNVSQSFRASEVEPARMVPLAARPRRAVLARRMLRRRRVAGWWLSVMRPLGTDGESLALLCFQLDLAIVCFAHGMVLECSK